MLHHPRETQMIPRRTGRRRRQCRPGCSSGARRILPSSASLPRLQRLGWILILATALSFVVKQVEAYCSPPDSFEQQDKFYKCVRNMDMADQNENDLLDPDEFETYIKSMVFSLFVVAPFALRGPLPHELQHDLYDKLIHLSGNAHDDYGNPQIDVYGSNVMELPLIEKERMDALREVCWATVDALLDFGPHTSAPKKMVLTNVKHQNDQAKNKKKNQGNNTTTNDLWIEEPDEFSNILSIHSSFVVANFEGLDSFSIREQIARDGTLSRSFVEFLLDLFDVECPTHDHWKECWEDPWVSYEDALEEDGSLCGSHAEWVRRIFCGGIDRQRDLLLGWEEGEKEEKDSQKKKQEQKIRARIENVILYRVQDSRCPIPMNTQGKGGGHAPLCQTIYGHYLLHLHHIDVEHKEEIEELYVNITQAAIDNGMLQDSLKRRDPDSVYVVEAAGPRIRPPVHKHTMDPFPPHHHHHRRLSCRRRQLLKHITSYYNEKFPGGELLSSDG